MTAHRKFLRPGFIATVLLRPKMYTIGGSFEEVVAFLDGYFGGMALTGAGVTQVGEWTAFKLWLARELDVDASVALETFRAKHKDNTHALDGLREWLGRFLHQHSGHLDCAPGPQCERDPDP